MEGFKQALLDEQVLIDMLEEELEQLKELSKGDNPSFYYNQYYTTKGMLDFAIFSNAVGYLKCQELFNKLNEIHTNRGRGV